jgi:phosphopantetheine adenylyltransferase
MLRESVIAEALDILGQIDFFNSEERKALLHLVQFTIKLSDARVTHSQELILELRVGLLNFKESLILIIVESLKQLLDFSLELSFGLLQGMLMLIDGLFEIMRV